MKPSSSGPGRAIEGVFRDLRDRRLIPVVLLLVVLLFAVPMLLGKEETPPPPATSAATAKPSYEAEPVVLTSEPELREYQDRLDAFQARNPFHQKVPKAVEEDAAANEGGAAVDTSGDTGTAPIDGSTDPTVPPVDPIDPIDPEDPTVPPDDDGGETMLVTTRVDVRVGPVGDTEVLRDVQYLDFLPDRQRPVLEYLQGDFDLTNAVFIVSPFVITSEGDGKCAPTPKDCQFIQLEVGKTHAFQYDDGERYTLTLLDVNLHEEPLAEATDGEAGREADLGAAAPIGKKIIDG